MDHEFNVLYRESGNPEARRSRLEVLRSLEPFNLAPIRDARNYHGQSHRVGWYMSSKVERPLQFESLLERRRMQILDFDQDVLSYSAQPFTLEWSAEDNKRHYTPDIYIIWRNLSRSIEDVKYFPLRLNPRQEEAHIAMAQAARSVGFEFKIWFPPEKILGRNIEYLAGYRFTPIHFDECAKAIREALSRKDMALCELARICSHEAIMRPAIYHLIWTHAIFTNLNIPLHQFSVISLASQNYWEVQEYA